MTHIAAQALRRLTSWELIVAAAVSTHALNLEHAVVARAELGKVFTVERRAARWKRSTLRRSQCRRPRLPDGSYSRSVSSLPVARRRSRSLSKATVSLKEAAVSRCHRTADAQRCCSRVQARSRA